MYFFQNFPRNLHFLLNFPRFHIFEGLVTLESNNNDVDDDVDINEYVDDNEDDDINSDNA